MTRAVLPDYLQFNPDATPNRDAVVLCGDVRITVITQRLIRIEQGAFTDAATLMAICRNFERCSPIVNPKEGVWHIDTGMLTITCDPSVPLEDGLSIHSKGEVPFLWRFGQSARFNLGGTTSTLDRINGPCPLEDGVCAKDGFVFIDDSETPLFAQDGWFAPREKCTDVYFFGYGHDYTAAVQDYQRLTGTPGMLPAFALGNWWSRYYPYTAADYLKLLDDFERHDVPLSVGIVDMDWHLTEGEGRTYRQGWTGYTWNEQLFLDYKGFLAELRKRGIKTALNLHPADGIRAHEIQYEAVARAMKIDPTTKATVGFNCLDPKFLQNYFENVLFPYEKDGVDFWWIDWQQGKDYKAFLKENYQPSELESITPLWMNNHMHYMASRRNGKRGMVFSRFAGYGSQRYPIGFSGDTYITWESLDFQPYFTATASNIGYGWWSHDIGGHMGGVKDDELTVRWIQLGVLSPIFRLHSTSSVFLGREPWNYNKRAECIISDFMRLRHRLFPYLYTMNRRSAVALVPLIRPMYHINPEEKEAYNVPNEYWYGSEMVAAPITCKADDSDLGHTSVWLPEGVWTDAFTGVVYKGNQKLEVYRPQEHTPLFLKAGAIVPMQRHVKGSRALGGAKEMELLIAPGASGCFDLYEDDGESDAYERGDYCVTPIRLIWKENCAVLTIHPIEGNSAFVPQKRKWIVKLRGFRAGCTAMMEGSPIVVTRDDSTNTCSMVLDASAGVGTSVVITHECGLIHDNCDVRERVIALLVRAQVTQELKNQLLRRFDDCQVRRVSGKPIILENAGADMHASLGRMMYELMMQEQV